MNKSWKRGLAMMLAVFMVFTAAPGQAWAAKKTIKLSKSSVTLEKGKSVKVTVKNKTGAKIKKVTYKITKGKSAITLAKKTKTYVKIKGKKVGSAKISVKAKTNKKKTYTKTIKVKVVKAAEKTTNTGCNTNGNTNTGGNTVKPTEKTTEKATESKEEKAKAYAKAYEKAVAHYDMSTSEDGKKLVDKTENHFDGTLYNMSADKKEYDSLQFKRGSNSTGSYIELPKEIFAGKDTLTISLWIKNLGGSLNTSAMYAGTKDNPPASYWLLNPANGAGQLKSVFTDDTNKEKPYTTEKGFSPSDASRGIAGPKTGTDWDHYVTVLTPKSITAYYNGAQVGQVELTKSFSEFGNDLVAYLGRSSYPDQTFEGYIREVAVFDEEKNEEEVQALYKASKADGMNEIDESKKSEIFIADRADPYITKADDGYYYFTASFPMYGSGDKTGYDRVILRRSKTLEGLKNAEEKTIWNCDDSQKCFRHIWAPEMHKIKGKWYVFYAASDSSTDKFHIDCNVLMCKGNDPYTDEWEEKGKFQKQADDSKSFGGFSLDMTYFENNNKHYVIWAEKTGAVSKLSMAEINPDEPWKIITQPITLSTPEYSWEKNNGQEINEGPSVLKHDGKVFVAFSASTTGPEYCVGLLYADAASNLMDPKSWTKKKEAALTSGDLPEEYGPGHNSFTVDDAGNPIFVYHSRPENCYKGACGYKGQNPLYDPCRSAHLRKVTWGADGLPVLNSEPLNFGNTGKKTEMKLTSENQLGGYLYVCFADTKSGKDVQQIHFFLSKDGLNWTAVNGCLPAYMTGTKYPTANYDFVKNWKQETLSSKLQYDATPGATTNGAFYDPNAIKETTKGDASVLFPFEGRDHGLRDPYLIRGSLKDGSDANTIRILATDLNIFDKQYGNTNWGRMTSSKESGDKYDESGSGGSKQLFIFETKDFVNWERRTVDVATEMNGGCAWAPEAVYNPQKDNYLVYWSCRTEADGYARNRLYCNETKDFKHFGPTKLYEQEPFYKDWGKFVGANDGYGNIDTSQLWVGKGSNKYDTLYRVVKDETNNHIQLMKANSVLDPKVDYNSTDPTWITPFIAEDGKSYSAKEDLKGKDDYQKASIVWNWFAKESTGDHFEKIDQKHMECFNGAYEGATMFKFIDRDEWCVMIDFYGNNSVRYEPYLTTDLSQANSVRKATAGTYGRTGGDVGCHGGIIPITVKEYNQIIKSYNNEERYSAITGIEKDKIRTKANNAGCVYHDIAPLQLSK